jgi:hypothetical protein
MGTCEERENRRQHVLSPLIIPPHTLDLPDQAEEQSVLMLSMTKKYNGKGIELDDQVLVIWWEGIFLWRVHCMNTHAGILTTKRCGGNKEPNNCGSHKYKLYKKRLPKHYLAHIVCIAVYLLNRESTEGACIRHISDAN